MSIGIKPYVPEQKETRKNYCIRLNEDEVKKVSDIMFAYGVPDFSKCIRFLIQQGYNSIGSTEARHD